MTHRRLVWLGLLLAALLGGCAAPQNCALVPLASMPLELSHNLLVVTVGINGKPARLVVDTGAERTTLTEAAVRRLGLGHARYQSVSSGIGGFSTSQDALVPGIVLGGTRFPVEHVTVGRFTLPDMFDGPVDGLLGADILLAFDLDLDIPDRRLTFYRVRHCALALPPWPAAEIAGVTARRDRMLVPIAVNDTAGLALLDTGSQGSGISQAMAERAGVTRAELAEDPTITVHGAAPNPVRVPVQRFRSVTVAGEPMLYPRLAVVPDSIGLGDGLVGADFIRSRRMWISFPTLHLFIAAAPGA